MDIYEKLFKRNMKSVKVYKDIYKTWLEYLNNFTCHVFIYDGLNFPSRELEKLLQVNGFVGVTIVKPSDKTGKTPITNPYIFNDFPIPVVGSMSGVTDFYDMFTTFTFTTPLHYGIRQIDIDCVIGDNNFSRQETYSENEQYAHLLTHIDLSIQAILINERSNKIILASNQTDADTVNSWYKSLANGKCLAITHKADPYTMLTDENLNIHDFNTGRATDITTYYRMRDNVLKAFYARYGLVGNQEKSERVINAELDTGLQRALFNIDDMLACRKEMCDKVNKMFGTNWKVEMNSKIYNQQTIDNKGGEIDVEQNN